MDVTNGAKASRCVATNSLLVVGQLPSPTLMCCFKGLVNAEMNLCVSFSGRTVLSEFI
jgi:hypothetical protein